MEKGINEWTVDQMKQAVIDPMINKSIEETNDQTSEFKMNNRSMEQT